MAMLLVRAKTTHLHEPAISHWKCMHINSSHRGSNAMLVTLLQWGGQHRAARELLNARGHMLYEQIMQRPYDYQPGLSSSPWHEPSSFVPLSRFSAVLEKHVHVLHKELTNLRAPSLQHLWEVQQEGSATT